MSDPNQSPSDPVSIHAFRGEGDLCGGASLVEMTGCFNPRLPGGRRRLFHSANAQFQTFQSTPSGGKATSCNNSCNNK